MIPMVLPSGKEILVSSGTESDPAADGSGFTDVSFHLEFKDLVDTAAEIGEMLRKAMVRIRPKRAKVELSVGVDARTGKITALWVEGGASGGLKLLLEWGDDAQLEAETEAAQ
jgi:hypothetical protein